MDTANKSQIATEEETEPYDEYECADHYKEPRPEELSLLGSSLRHLSVASQCQRRSSTGESSHLDIQIATTDSEGRNRSSSLASCDPTSCQSTCGPNPSRITLICLLILSIWVMAVLLMHLDKKLAISTEKLDDTNEKIKSLEDTAVIFRQRQRQQLSGISRKLSRLLNRESSSSTPPPDTSISSESDSWGWDWK